MSDYSGIVVFAEDPGRRKFWVNIWRNEDKAGAIFLSLSVREKTDTKPKAVRCDLHHVRGSQHYAGELELGAISYRVRVFRAVTRKGAIYLQVQFDSTRLRAPRWSQSLASRKE